MFFPSYNCDHLTLSEILHNKMVTPTKCVITIFLRKSDASNDQNTWSRSDLNQVIEKVEKTKERSHMKKFKEQVSKVLK